MTKDEALKKMQTVKSYMTSGNPIWSVTEMGEAFDMAIEALEQPKPHLDEWCTDCKEYDSEKHSCPRFNHVIRNAMEQRWIPVTERLPDEDYCTGRGIQHSESVLVTVVHHANDDDVFVDMACTVDGKWQLTYPFDDDPDIPKWCEIIAWMPLPEPYEGEQS